MNAKHIIICILATLSLSPLAFAEKSGRYVNSREGLNIREEPNAGAAKVGALKYGEFVAVAGEGEKASIDGIEARWAKIIINLNGLNLDDDYNTYGWVFGGYLQEKCPMSEEEIISYLKRLSKTDEDWLQTEYFPEDSGAYMQGKEWERPDFSRALPNYASYFWHFETNNEVVAVRDCLMYWKGYYGSLRFVKAGTKFKVLRVADWGMEDGILYPIYETDDDTLIRGIDVTGSDSVSRASDGKGGFHTLVYQPILEDTTLDDVYEFNQWRNGKRTLAEALEEYFSSTTLYEGRFLRGGLETNFAEYTDPQGKTYRLGIGSRASFLKLRYPLNMDNPVPILEAGSYSDVMRYYLTKLSTLEAKSDGRAYLREICEYGYTSADGGYDGLAYHYFDDDGVYVYQYQTDEMGNIEENQRYQYVQYGNPYEFHSISNSLESGEPTGKSRFGCFTKGSYWNPICRLKLRSSAGTGGEVLGTIEGGTLLEALEEGKKATIDGYTSAWVKVRAVNRERFVDGGDFTQTGWVFGAYLD
nr:SH3 domain-containing protein [Treponema sp.]